MVRVSAERDDLLSISTQCDGSEDTDWSVVHQLGGDVGQGVAVED
jgi:hypothetical protein